MKKRLGLLVVLFVALLVVLCFAPALAQAAVGDVFTVAPSSP